MKSSQDTRRNKQTYSSSSFYIGSARWVGVLDVTYTYGRTTKDEKRQASRSRIASHYGWDSAALETATGRNRADNGLR
jgi:hypothetical protein